MTTQFKARLSADLFRRAQSCVSTEETRYYLNGVAVEACAGGGAVLVSTDGHRMICLRDAEAEVSGPDVIVAIDKATLAVLKHRLAAFVVITGDRLQIEDKDGGVLHIQAQGCLIDGTFPDWRRAVPNLTTDRVIGTFNAALLAPLAAALCDGKMPAAGCYAADVANPILVIGTLSDAFGVLMPIRDGRDPFRPSWVDGRAKVEAAA